jgi:hypothetical protein
MSFISVNLSDWDCSKVSIGKLNKDSKPTVLYSGKIPVLTISAANPSSKDVREKYVVVSKKGLQKSMKYDEKTKKSTDIWDGEWKITFTICDIIDKASPMQKKLIDIFEDIAKKVELAFEKKPDPRYMIYSFIEEENPTTGVKKIVGIDKTKGAALKVKVPYEAKKDAKTMKDDKGKEVPIFEDRIPKVRFYDITRAVNQFLIKEPHKECNTGMGTVPKFMISLFQQDPSSPIYITKRLFECYYEPADLGGNQQDNDLIETLRSSMAELTIDPNQ